MFFLYNKQIQHLVTPHTNFHFSDEQRPEKSFLAVAKFVVWIHIYVYSYLFHFVAACWSLKGFSHLIPSSFELPITVSLSQVPDVGANDDLRELDECFLSMVLDIVLGVLGCLAMTSTMDDTQRFLHQNQFNHEQSVIQF